MPQEIALVKFDFQISRHLTARKNGALRDMIPGAGRQARLGHLSRPSKKSTSAMGKSDFALQARQHLDSQTLTAALENMAFSRRFVEEEALTACFSYGDQAASGRNERCRIPMRSACGA
jgi:hypothetical protein